MVELRKVSIGNIGAALKCMTLKLLPEQKSFVASNRNSLIQAFGINRRMIGKGSKAIPYAIYANSEMVGFIMYGFFTKKFDNKYGSKYGEDHYYFWRFMIDKNHQGKGYASKALVQILNEIRQKPHGDADYCYVSYEPANEVVRKWYQNLGFEETGKINNGELVARMAL